MAGDFLATASAFHEAITGESLMNPLAGLGSNIDANTLVASLMEVDAGCHEPRCAATESVQCWLSADGTHRHCVVCGVSAEPDCRIVCGAVGESGGALINIL